MGPHELIVGIRRSQRELLTQLHDLDDAAAAAPSLLPGWSRGHVLTHIARNAEAVGRLAGGACRDEQVDMYPGGPDARATAIEAGAARPAAELVADVAATGAVVLAALESVPHEAWSRTIRWRRPLSAAELPRLRWGEVEIHRVDLGLGYRPSDWPREFVSTMLEAELSVLAARVPTVTPPALPDADLLAWVLGRAPADSGLPSLPAWP